MRTLVVLAVLGCTCASAFLQYTPAVAAERARFAQLYKAQAAAAAAAPDTGAYNHHQAGTYQHTPSSSHHQTGAYNSGKWQGPFAATVPAGLPGSGSQVADTADVTAARNAFLATYKAQVAATSGHQTSHHHGSYTPHHTSYNAAPHYNAIPSGTQKWTGPVAATVGAGVGGKVTPVSDTAEVAAARNAFFSTYNAALSNTGPAAVHHQPQHNQGHWTAPQPAQARWTAPQPVQARWTGPVAATIPAGLPGSGSQVHQTADVASATAAFHQAYNEAVAATTGRRW